MPPQSAHDMIPVNDPPPPDHGGSTSSLDVTQNPDSLNVRGLLPGFSQYMAAERHFALKTMRGYREAITYLSKHTGDLSITELTPARFISFKAELVDRRVSASRIASIINALKCLLTYARDVLKLSVMDPGTLKTPKVPRREVTYLTPDELETFITAIPLCTWSGSPRLSAHCFRAVTETLVATGMRISEAMALDRHAINRERNEARIIGKGNKERTVFFTDRAIQWIDRYLYLRDDSNPALFVTRTNKRMTIDAVQRMFHTARLRARLDKRVTPHVLRHTTATNLLRNGCPIGFIKEILGHENLATTCRYYLGIMTMNDTKRAHQTYSSFQPNLPASSTNPSVQDITLPISHPQSLQIPQVPPH